MGCEGNIDGSRSVGYGILNLKLVRRLIGRKALAKQQQKYYE